ncbi:MAG: transposase, partial [Xanthomonadaceae bacterium]|nr:transposase [Xanthomonadaceae bacterium]
MLETTLSAADFDLLRAENERFQADNARFSAEIKRLSALVEKLTFQLAMLKRMQFGQKSEALSVLMGDLFGTPTDLEQPTAPPQAPPRKASREPKAAP